MPGYRGRIGEPPAFCNVHVDVQLDDDYQELGGQEVIIYRLAADPAAQIAALEAQLAPLTEALAAAQKHIASLVEQRTRQARLLGNYEEKVAEARVAGREMGLYSAAEWLRENCPGIAADEMVAALSLPDPPAPETPATEEECRARLGDRLCREGIDREMPGNMVHAIGCRRTPLDDMEWFYGDMLLTALQAACAGTEETE